ncbi:MAG: hypothetical protein H7X70_05940 [Candidatus Kapabacteria bacterium]|nr:hypothetical protein [Candidatus Kapabacteria bacterium]
MRDLLLFAIVCLCGTVSLTAQRVAQTPPSPVNIVKAGGIMHVFCARVDVNFNGALDSGDEPATWVQIDPATLLPLRSYTFPWADVKASRLGISETAKALFVGVDNTVEHFSLETQARIGVVYTGQVSAVSATLGGAAIYVSHRPSFTEPGSVVQITLATGDSVVYQAGPNPQQSARFITSTNAQGLLTLSEGNFGQPTGLFDIWKQSVLGAGRTSHVVGDTPNHFCVSGDSAYVTVNGSHWIVVINLFTTEAVDTILVGTSGFDGPRESVVSNGRLYVSTFAGDVRVFDVATGTRIGSIKLDAKPEGIALNGTDLWVTRAFVAGGYSAERNVAVYDLTQAVSVNDEPFSLSTPKAIYVTSNRVSLPLDFHKQITIRAIDGRRTDVQIVDSDSQTLDISSLTHGVYVVSDGTSAITLMR